MFYLLKVTIEVQGRIKSTVRMSTLSCREIMLLPDLSCACTFLMSTLERAISVPCFFFFNNSDYSPVTPNLDDSQLPVCIFFIHTITSWVCFDYVCERVQSSA